MTDAEMRPYIMRHDCRNGTACWNDIHRPRLELLKKCFGGLETKIKPQDVDGMVERNGYFLFLEFKGDRRLYEPSGNNKKSAIDICHEQLTQQYRIVHRPTMTLSAPTTTSVFVAGDSKAMKIEEMRVIYGGVAEPWEPCSLYDLQKLCWEWFEWTARLKEDELKRARGDVAALRPKNPFLRPPPTPPAPEVAEVDQKSS